jgi:hypothetical protein
MRKVYNTGEYLIRISSGLWNQDDASNSIAGKENIVDWVSQIIVSCIPDPVKWLVKDECFEAVIKTGLTPVNSN